jgi:hypothetical protein
MSNPAILVEDENEQILLAFANAGSATDPGGLLIVRSRANLGSGDVVPAFSVMNAEEELLNFSVGGDGSVVLGMDISGSSSFENDAQLNIHDLDNHDYLVNVADFIGDTRWLSVRKTGEVGIGESGTTNTALTLFKDGGNTYLDLLAGTSYNKAIRFMSTSSSSQARHIITEASGDFVIDPGVSGGGGNDRLKITGDVQIGTDKPTTSTFINSTSGEHNLSVNGWIVSKKVMVQTTDWADKVFAADYTLKSLADVEAYISQHKHLPEIPSECEVLENGVDVGEMNKLLLQKVEELTLYVIDLQKQVDELKK